MQSHLKTYKAKGIKERRHKKKNLTDAHYFNERTDRKLNKSEFKLQANSNVIHESEDGGNITNTSITL